jgi:hypothetical protein
MAERKTHHLGLALDNQPLELRPTLTAGKDSWALVKRVHGTDVYIVDGLSAANVETFVHTLRAVA